jgi:hypothetical protein
MSWLPGQQPKKPAEAPKSETPETQPKQVVNA